MNLRNILSFSRRGFEIGRIGLKTRNGDSINLACTVKKTSGNLVEARLLPGQLQGNKIDPEAPCILMMEDGSVIRTAISGIPNEEKLWLEISTNEEPPRHRSAYQAGLTLGLKCWPMNEPEPQGFEHMEISLSGEGLRFPGAILYKAGATVNVSLKLPDDYLAKPIQAIAKVVRSDKTGPGHWTTTCRFDSLAIRDYEEIVGYIIETRKKDS